MDADRWQQVQEILADLLEAPAAERERLLGERCGEDAELRAELESLLAAAADADGYLEDVAERSGLLEDSARHADEEADTGSVEIGETIAHYRVDGILGRGGMGEVYRATDVRLGRQVAMKVLPVELARDPDNVARFKREARLLAALNHPNIAAIYDVEESGERKVLILELVEGPTLADRIRDAGARGLGVDASLTIARQIAAAVEAAHDLGIVHRDLKPANVKVTARERIKVLDLGIAKPEWAAAIDGPEGGGVVPEQPEQTEAGRVFGTAAYMSPEQARGERVDRRSDIWAFGCILFEMLTGRRALASVGAEAVRAPALESDVDWDVLPMGVPAAVRVLLERCLCKDVRQRLQAIGEARIVLDRVLAGGEDTSAAVPARPGWRLPWWAAVAASVVTAAIAWIAYPASTPAPPASVQRLQLVVHPDAQAPAISPDGSKIAYTERGRMWIYPLDTLVGRQVPGVDRVYNPSWSPDGEEMAYAYAGKLWRIRPDGGEPAVVGELPPGMGYMDWGENDEIVISVVEGLYSMPARGGEPRLLMRLEPGERRALDPHVAPGGAILFVNGDRTRIDAWVGGERRTILESEGAQFRRPHWVDENMLAYVRQGTSPGIWAVAVDPGSLRPAGEPVLVDPSSAVPTISRRGQIVFQRDGVTMNRLVRVSHDGTVRPSAIESQLGLRNPAYLPATDEAVVVALKSGVGKLWVHSLTHGGEPRPLTFDLDQVDRYPVVSPTGHLLLYSSDRGGTRYLVLTTLDQPSQERIVDHNVIRGTFTPDGSAVVYAKRDMRLGTRLWIAPARGDGDPRVLIEEESGVDSPRVSPDARWIAYVGSRMNAPTVLVRAFPQGPGPWQVSRSGGDQPRWSPDGRELYYAEDGRLMGARVGDVEGGTFVFEEPRELFDAHRLGLLATEYQVLPDGSGFLMVEQLTDEDPLGRSALVLVQGWSGLVQREPANGS